MHKTRTSVKLPASGLFFQQIEDHRGPPETSYGDISRLLYNCVRAGRNIHTPTVIFAPGSFSSICSLDSPEDPCRSTKAHLGPISASFSSIVSDQQFCMVPDVINLLVTALEVPISETNSQVRTNLKCGGTSSTGLRITDQPSTHHTGIYRVLCTCIGP